jgi:hypothetical protein
MAEQTNYLGLAMLAGAGLLIANQMSNQPATSGTALALLPASGDAAQSDGAEGLSGLGQTMQQPSNWYQLSNYVQVLIPYPVRSVRVSGNAFKQQFNYNGQWFDGDRLLRVWNPIRQLPSWLR